MTIIKRSGELTGNCPVALILGKGAFKKGQFDSFISKETAERFFASDKKFDYLKLEDNFIFLVKEDQKAEELRIIGSKIQGLVADSFEQISLLGKVKSVLFLAEGLALANYQFNRYFTKPTNNKLESILVQEDINDDKINELNNTIKSVYWTRNVVNTPVNNLNATQLAEEIVRLGDEAEFSVQVLEKTQIESLKMGGLLAVNKGSIDPPTFTIAEYKPKKVKNKKPIVLVGKGVVYDTGGLSLKPTPGSMDTMKSDMAGAAAVAGAIYLAALQKLPLHIIALIPATDNRPGGNAYTPGDVITMFDGTTVEVLNTDAEGRMILADALAYAGKYDPEIVIDAATLTGAAVRAIGTEASIIMGNAKDSYFESLEKAGFETWERVVRFPFWDDYKEHMKSKIADLKNIGSANAGMISAGKFLEHFCKSPYIHMDVAGPTWLDSKENYRGFGGTGAGVRLLYEFFKTHYL
jgi:leucyl aminopeptidase